MAKQKWEEEDALKKKAEEEAEQAIGATEAMELEGSSGKEMHLKG